MVVIEWQTARWSSPQRSEYGSPSGTVLVGSPSAAASADGRLELLWGGADSALYHVWERSGLIDNWSGWFLALDAIACDVAGVRGGSALPIAFASFVRGRLTSWSSIACEVNDSYLDIQSRGGTYGTRSSTVALL